MATSRAGERRQERAKARLARTNSQLEAQAAFFAKHGRPDLHASYCKKKELALLVRDWFEALDADHSGLLDTSDLEEPLTAAGIIFGRPQLEAMVAAVDADGSGAIDVDELFAVIEAGLRERPPAPAATGKGGAAAASLASAAASGAWGDTAPVRLGRAAAATEVATAAQQAASEAAALSDVSTSAALIGRFVRSVQGGEAGDPAVLGLPTRLAAYRRRLVLDGICRQRGAADGTDPGARSDVRTVRALFALQVAAATGAGSSLRTSAVRARRAVRRRRRAGDGAAETADGALLQDDGKRRAEPLTHEQWLEREAAKAAAGEGGGGSEPADRGHGGSVGAPPRPRPLSPRHGEEPSPQARARRRLRRLSVGASPELLLEASRVSAGPPALVPMSRDVALRRTRLAEAAAATLRARGEEAAALLAQRTSLDDDEESRRRIRPRPLAAVIASGIPASRRPAPPRAPLASRTGAFVQAQRRAGLERTAARARKRRDGRRGRRGSVIMSNAAGAGPSGRKGRRASGLFDGSEDGKSTSSYFAKSLLARHVMPLPAAGAAGEEAHQPVASQEKPHLGYRRASAVYAGTTLGAALRSSAQSVPRSSALTMGKRALFASDQQAYDLHRDTVRASATRSPALRELATGDVVAAGWKVVRSGAAVRMKSEARTPHRARVRA